MKELTREELFALFDESVHSRLEDCITRYPDCEGVVVFENQMMGSSELGMRSAVVVGPSNTYKSIADCEGKWINDLPSRRQYASYYWKLSPEERSEIFK